ncbi:MAG: sugar ABC transporter permease [Bacillota bacterium]
MLTPLVVYILGFTFGPVLYTIFLSLKDKYSGDFPTLTNYIEIIGHGQFSRAFFNTVFITLAGLALQMTTGLILALMLNRNFRGRGLMRALLLVPLGVPTLVSAVNMSFIFGTSGYLNELLYRIGLARVPIDWASGGIKTLLVVVVADLWKVMPIVTLLLLAGLETIPGDVYEAGAVDGTTAWQRFRYITLPLLKPSITMALILRAIDVFRIFDLPLVLAGRVTPVVATYAYFEYFAWNNEFTSAAAATILLGMIVVFTFGYLFVAEREREGVY